MNSEPRWQEVERRSVSLIDKGIMQRDLGLYEEALTSFNQAVDISRTMSHKSDPVALILAHALDNKARALMDLGLPAEAIPCLDEAISVHEGIVRGDRILQDIREIAVSVMNKGAALMQLGCDEEALACFKCALQGFNQCESGEDMAHVMINCGILCLRHQRFDDALPLFDEALTILESETAYDPEVSKSDCAYALALKADVLLTLGRSHEALDASSRSVGIFRAVVSHANRAGERGDLADALNLRGEVLTILGRIKEAAKCFQEAEELCKGEPVWSVNMYSLNSLA